VRVALVGAELEENLGIRYMASALEQRGHEVEIVPFNSEADTSSAVRQVTCFNPQIVGLSMVFTSRAREFCGLANALREGGYSGQLVAGGHFASFNCKKLLTDFPAFDSVALGEGELVLCQLAENLGNPSKVLGLCHRTSSGSVELSSPSMNPQDLDALPFPKRTSFHSYFGKPIASILSSRGCWRDCAFCSISAWYKQAGGKNFRVRSINNIVAEMSDLYFHHGVQIFNFQDDNFFLPNRQKSVERFETLRDGIKQAGIGKIAIAVKARPDSITRESISVLDKLGLFRVFLGVENASENGLRNLNRKQTVEDILNALVVLNDFDVHVAFNILMFEVDTTMEDILTNLRFIERHVENPFNFCRAEAYAGTGLETKLRARGLLLGDYFGFDYRINDPKVEAFHQIANYAFFDRNFSDFGLHYFNMQVDFFFQILRRFHPEFISQSLRALVRNFIKQTNLDTFESLSRIFDFVREVNTTDELRIHRFAREMRERIDTKSMHILSQGKKVIDLLERAYQSKGLDVWEEEPILNPEPTSTYEETYSKPAGLESQRPPEGADLIEVLNLMGSGRQLIPYDLFKKKLDQQT
jgi:anaerobic magnesium-protoporphyrin IX monomethyl ester cyclase